MTVGSLFSGIGGMDLGFEWAGFETKWFCEIEEYPRKVLKKHWPNVPIINDIRDVTKESVSRVDCLIGGFPCQDISYAGKGAGIDYDLSEQEGTRSGLWWEYWRVIRELRPRYVVAENVSALTDRGLDIVLGSLAQIGYDAEWQIVSAAAVGAPHIRERIFIMAYPSGLGVCKYVGECAGNSGKQRTPGVGRFDWEQLRMGTRGGTLEGWSHKGLGISTRPEFVRTSDGLPGGMDIRQYERCAKGLGNAVVPQVAYLVAMAVKQHTEGK